MSDNAPQKPNSQPQQPPEPTSSTALAWPARMAFGVAGAAASVFGVIGVFTKDASSAGVPVLLALGAFFGYVAASGQRLRSLRVGDNEIALDRIATAVTRSVLKNPAVPVEAKGDVAAALEDVRTDLPTTTRRAMSEVRSEQFRSDEYNKVLRAWLRGQFPQEYIGDTPLQGGGLAACLQAGNRLILVAPRYEAGSNVGPSAMEGLVSEHYPSVPLLLVSNASIGELYYAFLERLHPEPDKVEFVQWRGGGDDSALVQAIKQKLDPPTATA